MNKREKLFYLAGFFDGEGAIFIGKDKNYRSKNKNTIYRLCVSCGNTYSKPIKILYEMFSISKKITYREGQKIGYKPWFQWLLTANLAMNFLKEIVPYLIVKKKQALLGISFQEWKNSLPKTGRKRPEDILKTFETYHIKMWKINQFSI